MEFTYRLFSWPLRFTIYSFKFCFIFYLLVVDKNSFVALAQRPFAQHKIAQNILKKIDSHAFVLIRRKIRRCFVSPYQIGKDYRKIQQQQKLMQKFNEKQKKMDRNRKN